MYLILFTVVLDLCKETLKPLAGALEAVWSCGITKLLFCYYFRLCIKRYRRHEIGCMAQILYLGYYGNPALFTLCVCVCVSFAFGEHFLPRLFQRPLELSSERSVSSLLSFTHMPHWVITGRAIFAETFTGERKYEAVASEGKPDGVSLLKAQYWENLMAERGKRGWEENHLWFPCSLQEKGASLPSTVTICRPPTKRGANLIIFLSYTEFKGSLKCSL